MTSFKILHIKGGDVMTNDYKISSSQKVGGAGKPGDGASLLSCA